MPMGGKKFFTSSRIYVEEVTEETFLSSLRAAHHRMSFGWTVGGIKRRSLSVQFEYLAKKFNKSAENCDMCVYGAPPNFELNLQAAENVVLSEKRILKCLLVDYKKTQICVDNMSEKRLRSHYRS